MRKTWRFRQPLREVLVVRKGDATVKEKDDALPFAVAAHTLRDVMRENGLGRNLGLPIVYELCGLGAASTLPPSRNSRWIVERLEEALMSGRLLVVPQPLPVGSGIGVTTPIELEPTPAPQPVEEEEKKTWIEIELLNMKGEPIPGEAFVLTLADGTTRKGRLNRDGLARLDGLVDGNCKVTFPNFDGREWRPK